MKPRPRGGYLLHYTGDAAPTSQAAAVFSGPALVSCSVLPRQAMVSRLRCELPAGELLDAGDRAVTPMNAFRLRYRLLNGGGGGEANVSRNGGVFGPGYEDAPGVLQAAVVPACGGVESSRFRRTNSIQTAPPAMRTPAAAT